jgi:hypothetical protein
MPGTYRLVRDIDVENGYDLVVAGRWASSDVRVHGAIRVQPACVMMGQAAGTAAVQSVRTGEPAGELDTAMLVRTLRENGAYLPQKELSRTMTRRPLLRTSGRRREARRRVRGAGGGRRAG